MRHRHKICYPFLFFLFVKTLENTTCHYIDAACSCAAKIICFGVKALFRVTMSNRNYSTVNANFRNLGKPPNTPHSINTVILVIFLHHLYLTYNTFQKVQLNLMKPQGKE